MSMPCKDHRHVKITAV